MKIDGTRLSIIRATKGWTQADLAYAAGLSRSFVSQLESGSRGLSPEKLLVIADALSVDIDHLVSTEDRPSLCNQCGASIADA